MRERIELFVGAALAAIGVALHAVFFRGAGAFWRDEVISIRVAAAPSFASIWRALRFESFLLLWTYVLRAWTSIAGLTPTAIRSFGFLIGVLTLVAAWLAVRLLGGRNAAVALAILATNAAAIRYGDSIRGYGVGMIAGVLAFALIGRGERVRGWRAFAIALAATIASVHVTYPNAVLVFACCVAAAIVQRSWKPLAIGFIAALTLVPYVPMILARANDALRDSAVTPGLWTSRFVIAVGVPAAIAVAASVAWKRELNYPTLTIAILLPLHFVYMRAVGYFPQPWYFTLPIIVLAVAADVNLTLRPMPRALIAAAVAALTIPLAAGSVAMRQTNVDEVAALLNAKARRGDLIVVYPWYVDASFSMYYSGAAEWQSLPPIADHSVQRFDLVARAIMTPGAEQPLVARAATVLHDGHTLWLVGFPLFADRAISADRHHMTRVEAADAQWCAALLRVIQQNAHHEAIALRGGEDIVIFERLNVATFTR